MLRTRLDPIRFFVACAGIALLVSSAACGGGDEPAPAGGTPSAAKAPATNSATDSAKKAGGDVADANAEAAEIFRTRCYTCHGLEGRGDGPGSVALEPKPRNFQDPEWQASVSDEHIANIIRYGGAAVGRSPTMPGNPDLSSRDAVVAALVDHVRDLGEDED